MVTNLELTTSDLVLICNLLLEDAKGYEELLAKATEGDKAIQDRITDRRNLALKFKEEINKRGEKQLLQHY